MPETSREVFMEMRERIDHVLVTDWASYISTMSDAYDTAFNNVNKLLDAVHTAIIERQKAEQALMVTTLSILTGGAAGILAEGLVKRLPVLEKTVFSMQGGLVKVMKVAREDPVLYKVFKDTTKDLVKKGIEKVDDLALDQFKAEPPSSGFEPVGMRVDTYRDQLTQGIIDRGTYLWNFADFLYDTADNWSPEFADTMRQGLYRNDFFQKKPHLHKEVLVQKAELALWSAWALPRDEDYWTKQVAMQRSGLRSEALDWAPVRNRLKDLGVPEDAISVSGIQWGFVRSKAAQGLDVIGFMKWVKSSLVHTLFDGIPVNGGATTYNWASAKMLQAIGIVASLS
jgi:hypothetical protein